MNKYNERLINRLYNKGGNIIRMVKYNKSLQGSGHVLADGVDNSNRMLAIIEKLKGLTTDHFRGNHKDHYNNRFERERESALASLWSMYEALQHYNENGVFLDSASGMTELTPRLEEHLVRTGHEAAKNGTFYREKLNRKTPITEGPLASVKGMVCDMYGPRWESPKIFKMCSRIDEINSGRSVMAIKETQNYRDSLEYETYTVKLFPEASYYYTVDASISDPPKDWETGEAVKVNSGRKMIHGNWVDIIESPSEAEARRFSTFHHKVVMEWSENVGHYRSTSRMGEGREHTVRVAVHKKIN